jgi:hypothetical protein
LLRRPVLDSHRIRFVASAPASAEQLMWWFSFEVIRISAEIPHEPLPRASAGPALLQEIFAISENQLEPTMPISQEPAPSPPSTPQSGSERPMSPHRSNGRSGSGLSSSRSQHGKEPFKVASRPRATAYRVTHLRRSSAHRFPARSFFGGFPTPAPILGRSLAPGPHPKPFPIAVINEVGMPMPRRADPRQRPRDQL